MANVFIMHASEDKLLVEDFRDNLINVFDGAIDIKYSTNWAGGGGVPAEADWKGWIIKQIQESRICIALFTQLSVKNPWVTWEWGAAIGYKNGSKERSDRSVFAIKFGLENTRIRGPLEHIQTIDGGTVEGLSHLLKEINKHKLLSDHHYGLAVEKHLSIFHKAIKHRIPPTVAFVAYTKKAEEGEFYQAILEGLKKQHEFPLTIREHHISPEDNFDGALEKAMREEPDFIVAIPGDRDYWGSNKVQSVLKDINKGKTKLIVSIQNEPADIKGYEGRIKAMQFNTETVMQKLAQYTKELLDRQSNCKIDKEIILTVFPSYKAAQKRKNEYMYEIKKLLPDLHNDNVKECTTTDGWRRESSREKVLNFLRGSPDRPPSLIVCGNDTMALGAVDAIMIIREENEISRHLNPDETPFVLGFDGPPFSMAAIADRGNPFKATIRTPLEEYGKRISLLIKKVLDGKGGNEGMLIANEVIHIPLDAKLLITEENAAGWFRKLRWTD